MGNAHKDRDNYVKRMAYSSKINEPTLVPNVGDIKEEEETG